MKIIVNELNDTQLSLAVAIVTGGEYCTDSQLLSFQSNSGISQISLKDFQTTLNVGFIVRAIETRDYELLTRKIIVDSVEKTTWLCGSCSGDTIKTAVLRRIVYDAVGYTIDIPLVSSSVDAETRISSFGLSSDQR